LTAGSRWAAFPDRSIDALAFASTSSGYAIGFDAEVALLQRLHQQWALPVGSSCLAAVEALRAFGIERVAVVHPPWFDDETNDLGAAYFRAQGFDVVASRADTLPGDPTRTQPGPIIDWVSRHLSDQTEAVFFGGNGFRAAGAVERLERRIDRLVLEANQVLLWSILAATQTTLDITGYGRLLRESLPTTGTGVSS
jgi:maleate isomerase